MNKGILVKHEKLIKNGAHAYWQRDALSSKLWKHTVTIKEGDKDVVGTAQSTKEEPAWKVGSEYTYEINEVKGHLNIKSLKLADNNFSSNVGGYVEAPNRQALIISQSCTGYAVQMLQLYDPSVITQINGEPDGVIKEVFNVAKRLTDMVYVLAEDVKKKHGK